jgi:hypothetical protein
MASVQRFLKRRFKRKSMSITECASELNIHDLSGHWQMKWDPDNEDEVEAARARVQQVAGEKL